jgi:hypothetical protein
MAYNELFNPKSHYERGRELAVIYYPINNELHRARCPISTSSTFAEDTLVESCWLNSAEEQFGEGAVLDVAFKGESLGLIDLGEMKNELDAKDIASARQTTVTFEFLVMNSARRPKFTEFSQYAVHKPAMIAAFNKILEQALEVDARFIPHIKAFLYRRGDNTIDFNFFVKFVCDDSVVIGAPEDDTEQEAAVAVNLFEAALDKLLMAHDVPVGYPTEIITNLEG